MMTQAERWDQIAKEIKEKTDLKELVRDFFAILDIVESNDEGSRDFHPNCISSCRVFDSHKLNAIIPRMKELSRE